MKILFIRSNPVNPDSRVEKEIATLAKAGHDVMLLHGIELVIIRFYTQKSCLGSTK